MEQTKKEYIAKLKKELDTIETRYQQIINENSMVGEDFRSQAYLNFHKSVGLRLAIDELEAKLNNANDLIKTRGSTIEEKANYIYRLEMNIEELLCHYQILREQKDKIYVESNEKSEKILELESQINKANS